MHTTATLNTLAISQQLRSAANFELVVSVLASAPAVGLKVLLR
jgi:hypothetical protein